MRTGAQRLCVTTESSCPGPTRAPLLASNVLLMLPLREVWQFPPLPVAAARAMLKPRQVSCALCHAHGHIKCHLHHHRVSLLLALLGASLSCLQCTATATSLSMWSPASLPEAAAGASPKPHEVSRALCHEHAHFKSHLHHHRASWLQAF